MFNLSEEDVENIELAKEEEGDTWKSGHLNDWKKRIKSHLRDLQGESCCYCRKNIAGEFSLVLDIEHILPKSVYQEYMFETSNLAVACKRCNMDLKKADISFLVEGADVTQLPFKSSQFMFIHPNLDIYSNHLRYIVVIDGDLKLIKYQPVNSSAKGHYTYDYFKLRDLEIDSMDVAQGAPQTPDISDAISESLADRIRSLLLDR